MLTYSCPLEGSAAQCVEMSVRVVKRMMHNLMSLDVLFLGFVWFFPTWTI